MPPPEPRSSTVSPGLSCARAVGFPQPRDACTACSGKTLVCERSADFPHHHALGMSRQKQAHDAQPGLRSHGGKHVGEPGDILNLLAWHAKIILYFYNCGNINSRPEPGASRTADAGVHPFSYSSSYASQNAAALIYSIVFSGQGQASRIQDYGIVGDCRSAALISRCGSVDWLCWPRFDSPSIFAAILDSEKGGCWRIA